MSHAKRDRVPGVRGLNSNLTGGPASVGEHNGQDEFFSQSGTSPPGADRRDAGPHETEGATSRVGHLGRLASRWREEAARLRTLEAHGQAAALAQAADELEAATFAWRSELLTIQEAAAETGYSEEHLRRLARAGEVEVERNGGPKSRMRIRRGDLPVKPRKDGHDHPDRIAYDPDVDARSIAKIMGGTS